MRSTGKKGCPSCGGTGFSRSSSGLCDCAKPTMREEPAAFRSRALPPGTRLCEGCGLLTRAPALCASCEHQRDAMLRTDEAFNTRVRGQRAARLPSRERRERTSTPASSGRAPAEHRRQVLEAIRPRPVEGTTETRIEYDEDAQRATMDAFRAAEGPQRGVKPKKARAA